MANIFKVSLRRNNFKPPISHLSRPFPQKCSALCVRNCGSTRNRPHCGTPQAGRGRPCSHQASPPPAEGLPSQIRNCFKDGGLRHNTSSGRKIPSTFTTPTAVKHCDQKPKSKNTHARPNTPATTQEEKKTDEKNKMKNRKVVCRRGRSGWLPLCDGTMQSAPSGSITWQGGGHHSAIVVHRSWIISVTTSRSLTPKSLPVGKAKRTSLGRSFPGLAC